MEGSTNGVLAPSRRNILAAEWQHVLPAMAGGRQCRQMNGTTIG